MSLLPQRFPGATLTAFMAHPKNKPPVNCDCVCKKEEDVKCGDDSCINFDNRVECPKSCGATCGNQRIRRGIVVAPVRRRLVNEKMGFGVVAQQDIIQGTVVSEYIGVLKTAADYKSDQLQNPTPGLYGMCHLDGFVVDATEIDKIGRYINHGCKVNTESQIWLSDGKPYVLIVATRNILRGEWILFDYNLQRFRGKRVFRCECGKRGCIDEERKIKSCVVSLEKIETKGVQKMTALYCEICNLPFGSEITLQRHKNRHEEERTRTFACNKCDKAFFHESHLVRHLSCHKRKDYRYTCPIPGCNRFYGEKVLRDRHILDHADCPTVKLYSCPVCAKKFMTRSELNRHKKYHGTGREYKYACSYCERKYLSRENLTTHLARHKNPYSCDNCKRNYLTKAELNLHIKASHPSYNPFACVFCSKKYAEKKLLNRHVASSHLKAENEKLTFSCLECPKFFSNKSNLTRHQKIHSRNPKPYRCNLPEKRGGLVCTKAFARRERLLEHVKFCH